MYLEITGGTKQKRKYVENIAEFCAEKLMPRLWNLSVEIHLIPSLSKKEGIYGDCTYDDDTCASRPRMFIIRADSKLKLRKLLMTIAHEMVHVKQYARGELKQIFRLEKHRWKDKHYSYKTEYWDQPWEIEAHGREIGLFSQWCDKNNHVGKQWASEND